jgi:molybdate transport system regulatory protein
MPDGSRRLREPERLLLVPGQPDLRVIGQAAAKLCERTIDCERQACLVNAVMGKQKPKLADTAKSGDRLSIRLDLAIGAKIGPGKVAVLEEIARSGSISAAGRSLRMSYRRTWELVEELNRSLGTPVVETAAGGSGGGGTVLTRAGKAVIERYRAIEMDTALAARKHLLALNRACANSRPSAQKDTA